MGISFGDKIKLMKVLSTEEGKEKFKEVLVLKMKSQKAQETTALCIAEGLGEPKQITELVISSGEDEFLPLHVVFTADGVTAKAESVQPSNADFDYAAICADFNPLIKDNADEKSIFLEKVVSLLNGIIAENGVAADDFSVKIN